MKTIVKHLTLILFVLPFFSLVCLWWALDRLVDVLDGIFLRILEWK